MNAQDFKAGLEKLRRDYNQAEQDDDNPLRRSEMHLALIFKNIQEAAVRGEKYITLGKLFGEIDWNALQVLHKSGCVAEAMFNGSPVTDGRIPDGYRIVWNPTK